jgi:magnesium transporter
VNSRYSHAKPHSIPGTLQHIGARRLDVARMSVIEYDEQRCVVRDVTDPRLCRQPTAAKQVTWLNVDGTHDPQVMEVLGAQFNLHSLVLEDVMSAGERPKLEEHDNNIFLVLKMLDWDEQRGQIVVEQVSLVLGPDYVLTFQQCVGDVFDDVRERIRQSKGRIRKMGADYLAYALIDATVDHYFVVLEKVAEWADELDVEVERAPQRVRPQDMHVLKRELLFLRRAIAPARETLGTLAHIHDNELISNGVSVFLRDVHDHVVQVTETIELMRESLTSILDVYHAAAANRMNEVMKLLTVISTIFIPLTFVAGVYGMNFDNMPELHWQHGYFYALALMAGVGVATFGYVKWNRWL